MSELSDDVGGQPVGSSGANFDIGVHFGTPVGVGKLEHFPRRNGELLQLLLALETPENRHGFEIPTMFGLFESEMTLFERDEPILADLRANIDGAVRGFAAAISTSPMPDTAKAEMPAWFHVTRPGGYQTSHHHPMSTISGIYVVDSGDSPNPQAGAVKFYDPRGAVDNVRDLTNAAITQPFNFGNYEVRPEPGLLILFPSYLEHEVLLYDGERPRVIIAFNSYWSHG